VDRIESEYTEVALSAGMTVEGRSFSTSAHVPVPLTICIEAVAQLGERFYIVGTAGDGRIVSLRPDRWLPCSLRVLDEWPKGYKPAITPAKARGYWIGMRGGGVGYIEPCDVSDAQLVDFFQMMGGSPLTEHLVDEYVQKVGTLPAD